MEELNDVYQHFLLYYSQDIGKMKAAAKATRRRQRELRRQEREMNASETDEANDAEDDADNDDAAAEASLKHATRKSGYTMCIEAGLGQSPFLSICRSLLV